MEDNLKNKVCIKCRESKNLESFYFRKDTQNYAGYCKLCHNQIKKQNKQKESYKLSQKLYNNRPEIKERTKNNGAAWYLKNKERRLEMSRKLYHSKKEEIRLQRQLYRHRPEIKSRNKQKYKNDPLLQLNQRIKRSINAVLTEEQKTSKNWAKMLPYSREELKKHLESQFTKEMSWENFVGNICIDHIIPMEAFEYKSDKDEAFQLCWGLENLQPLFLVDNSKKADRLPCGILARNTSLKIKNRADYNSVKNGGLPLAKI